MKIKNKARVDYDSGFIFEFGNLFFQNQLLKLRRIRRLELHQISRYRMIETKFESMECQSSDRVGSIFSSISSITDNRMSLILHVYTNLILSAGFQIVIHL